jgi:hypothetical protein
MPPMERSRNRSLLVGVTLAVLGLLLASSYAFSVRRRARA